VINNFSNTGSGFSIEFGGTGTFLGPEAAFNTQPTGTLCVGEPITFSDASTFAGTIVSWQWNFGPGAVPATAIGPGPHTVFYNNPGVKSVVLTVESDGGCIVTEIATLTVECCDDHFSFDADVTSLTCPNDADGAIDLTVSSSFPPFTYLWSTGATTQDIGGLGLGNYTVTVVDESTCEGEATYTVEGPPPFSFDTLVIMPTCNGGVDGAVTLLVQGGTPPYEYNWEGSGFSANNTLSDISQGDYTVVMRDANGCEETLVLPVRELELQLDPAVAAITPPSCTGFSDASIVVVISNGLPPYQYDFNDGGGFGDENSLTGLTAGTYFVDVLDANLCAGSFEFEILDPPPLTLDFEVADVSCNGEDDGTIEAVAGGGVGNYSYSWNTGQNTATIGPLPPGDYFLTVRDGNGCEIEGGATVIEPPPVFIDVVDIVDIICFGDASGSITVAGSGGTPPFEYSLDGNIFQIEDTFGNLPAGGYTITVMDAMGCTETVDATVVQPPELIVDAGPDQFIQLGYSAQIRAVASEAPVTWQWSPADSLTCSDCSDPVAFPVNTTTYIVTVVNQDGCPATDEIVIRVIKDRPIYIPNAFSPNGDGMNDGFTIFGGPAARQIKTIKIFSRWGELVFEARNIPLGEEMLGWDGTFLGRTVNPGVFVFFVEVEFIDGEVVLYKGDVTVVR
jgi:gliding motility-associated-like protein